MKRINIDIMTTAITVAVVVAFAYLLKVVYAPAGNALISAIGALLAVIIAYGFSKDKNGGAALTGLVAWLTASTLLSPALIAQIQGVEVENITTLISSNDNVILGVICGVIGFIVYNLTYHIQLPLAFSFFSGRRLSAILVSIVMLTFSVIIIYI